MALCSIPSSTFPICNFLLQHPHKITNTSPGPPRPSHPSSSFSNPMPPEYHRTKRSVRSTSVAMVSPSALSGGSCSPCHPTSSNAPLVNAPAAEPLSSASIPSSASTVSSVTHMCGTVGCRVPAEIRVKGLVFGGTTGFFPRLPEQ